QILPTRDVGDFEGRQRPVEHAKIAHFGARESGVAKPVTDGQVRLAAVVGDILSQAVADDLGVDRRAVEEQLEVGSATRTIVSKSHVDPFIGGQWGSGA